MSAHRIADPRVLRGWFVCLLKAGGLEVERQRDGRRTPQSAGISPSLANVFPHYVLHHRWRKRKARGRLIIVRRAEVNGRFRGSYPRQLGHIDKSCVLRRLVLGR